MRAFLFYEYKNWEVLNLKKNQILQITDGIDINWMNPMLGSPLIYIYVLI